jgi:hypothetical protein
MRENERAGTSVPDTSIPNILCYYSRGVLVQTQKTSGGSKETLLPELGLAFGLSEIK